VTTLLRSIQEAAVGDAESISALLRRCKVLAVRLDSGELGNWVDKELNGYGADDALPTYRILRVRSLGHFFGPVGHQLRNAEIPRASLPEEYRDWVDASNLTQPIGAYEDLVRHQSGSDSFQTPWPADLLLLVGQRIYQHLNCLSAWQEIPRGALVALLDTVRNKVLSFALEIERLSPDAGEALPGAPPVASERVHQIFQTNIYGNVGNVAAGSPNSQQSVGSMVTAGDFASLATHLQRLGVGGADVADLKSAIESDRSAGKTGFGPKVGAWLGKMVGKAGEGALKVTVDTAASILTKLISGYLGLPNDAL
jgi:hypothetical protein